MCIRDREKDEQWSEGGRNGAPGKRQLFGEEDERRKERDLERAKGRGIGVRSDEDDRYGTCEDVKGEKI